MKHDIRFYRSSDAFGFLSNLYPCQVELDGLRFPSSEHAYQYAKFKRKDLANWVLSCPVTRYVAVIGHNLFYYDIVEGWNDIKIQRMKDVLYAKFMQNIDLKNKLLATGDTKIVEFGGDKYWGVDKNGKGNNNLGKLLMYLRIELRESSL